MTFEFKIMQRKHQDNSLPKTGSRITENTTQTLIETITERMSVLLNIK